MEQVIVLSKEVEELKTDVNELRNDVQGLVRELTKYKGFVGGVVFTFSCIVTAIGAWFTWKN